MDNTQHVFLKGGGEMGALTRAFDWSATPLGAPDGWPQSLRTTLSILLNSRFPMFLFWGPEHRCFYNDAYRPSLGEGEQDKQSNTLGRPGAAVWPEIWSIIGPQINQVIAGGEATLHEDSLVPFYRNGQMDVAYWTYSYSPVQDEAGQVAGVFVTCLETTRAVRQKAALTESEKRFQNLLKQATVGLIVLSGEHLTVTVVNEAYARVVGHPVAALLGRPVFEALPETEAAFRPILEQVIATGEPQYLNDAPYQLTDEQGNVIAGHLNLVYQPYREEDGAITGVMVVVNDVTDKVDARQQAAASQRELLALFEQSPVALATIRRERLTFTSANTFYGELVGRTPEEIISRPLLEALPELTGQGFDTLLNGVLDTGEPYIMNEVSVDLLRQGTLEKRYVNLAYQPMRDEQETVSGVLVVATDITEQVVARSRVEASEARFRSLVEEAPVATCLFTGRDLKIEVANEAMIQVWGKGRGVMGLPLAKALPELDGQPFLPLLDRVFTTGDSYEATAGRADLMMDGVLKTFYFDYTFKPLRNEQGEVYAILEMAIDVTAQVAARQKLEESESRFRNLVAHAPVAMLTLKGEEMVFDVVNEQMLAFLGRDASIAGRTVAEAIPESAGQQALEILHNVYRTGEPFVINELPVQLMKDGRLRDEYYNVSSYPLRESGEVTGIMQVAVDVTAQVTARRRVEEAQEALADAIELAELATWSLDLTTGILDYSARLRDWFGFDADEVITVETAYSVIRESDRYLVQDSMHAAIAPGSTSMYDAEYSAINRRTGKEHIVHAQGRAFFNEAGVACKVAGTAQDITIYRQVQMALGEQVQERTEELAATVEELRTTNDELAEVNSALAHSNDELAQYAYVASHDLQEPLRKIQVFAGMLTSATELTPSSRTTLGKINSSAARMSLLIRDLLAFSRLLKSDTLMRPVPLMHTVMDVWNDFELVVAEKNATIAVGELPVVEAVSLQMNQLFYNLVGNALKFSVAGRPPHIAIAARPATPDEVRQLVAKPLAFATYHHITVSDNGIGFDAQYNEQIFEVFKRLHGRDHFPGSGIGLSICRRIAGNHNGCLYAMSEAEKGSTFHILLPDRQRDEVSQYDGFAPMKFPTLN